MSDLAPIVVRGVEYDDLGYCRTSSGDLYGDGPVLHTVYCRYAGGRHTASSGDGCIRPGQDGPAIAAARTAEAERVKFTPPAYRQQRARREPGPTIAPPVNNDIVAVRGRPLGTDDDAWTTWEHLWAPESDTNSLRVALRRASGAARQPANLSPSEAQEIIREYESHVPGYEFKIVRARLVLDEKVIAG